MSQSKRWSMKKKAGVEVYCGQSADDIPNKRLVPLIPLLFTSYSGPDRGLAILPDLINKRQEANNSDEPEQSDESTAAGCAGCERWNMKSRKAYGICMSLYDQHPINGKISGDPIADSFAVCARKNNALLVVADGVNWGEKSKLASRCAVYGCVKYINDQLYKSGKLIRNTHEVFKLLLDSLNVAHSTIMKCEGGLTTLCVALVSPMKDSKQFVCCIVNVGDSLAYVFSKHHGIREITTGSHDITSERDIRDAGGALGPVNGEDPELHNLTCSLTFVDVGDILYLTTDGISDNFDPVVTKIAVAKRQVDDNAGPDDSNNLANCVQDGKPEMAPHERHLYAAKEMERIIHEFELFAEIPCSAQELCGCLLQHVLKLTDSKRKVLENPDLYGKKMKSKDRKRRDSEIISKMSKAPGKLDHATIVAYEVGIYLGNDEQNYASESEDEGPMPGSRVTGGFPEQYVTLAEPESFSDFDDDDEDDPRLFQRRLSRRMSQRAHLAAICRSYVAGGEGAILSPTAAVINGLKIDEELQKLHAELPPELKKLQDEIPLADEDTEEETRIKQKQIEDRNGNTWPLYRKIPAKSPFVKPKKIDETASASNSPQKTRSQSVQEVPDIVITKEDSQERSLSSQDTLCENEFVNGEEPEVPTDTEDQKTPVGADDQGQIVQNVIGEGNQDQRAEGQEIKTETESPPLTPTATSVGVELSLNGTTPTQEQVTEQHQHTVEEAKQPEATKTKEKLEGTLIYVTGSPITSPTKKSAGSIGDMKAEGAEPQPEETAPKAGAESNVSPVEEDKAGCMSGVCDMVIPELDIGSDQEDSWDTLVDGAESDTPIDLPSQMDGNVMPEMLVLDDVADADFVCDAAELEPEPQPPQQSSDVTTYTDPSGDSKTDLKSVPMLATEEFVDDVQLAPKSASTDTTDAKLYTDLQRVPKLATEEFMDDEELAPKSSATEEFVDEPETLSHAEEEQKADRSRKSDSAESEPSEWSGRTFVICQTVESEPSVQTNDLSTTDIGNGNVQASTGSVQVDNGNFESDLIIKEDVEEVFV